MSQTDNIRQVAVLLRQTAAATAAQSENWDNFEEICVDVIMQLLDRIEEDETDAA